MPTRVATRVVPRSPTRLAPRPCWTSPRKRGRASREQRPRAQRPEPVGNLRGGRRPRGCGQVGSGRQRRRGEGRSQARHERVRGITHRAVVLLGVGGSGADTLGESANFLTDADWLRSLLEFVRRGGCLVLQGDGEPAERSSFPLRPRYMEVQPDPCERADQMEPRLRCDSRGRRLARIGAGGTAASGRNRGARC